MNIAVVDTGTGNLRSVVKALQRVGAVATIDRDADRLRRADRFVVPGVGAFGTCMTDLASRGIIDVLEEEVRGHGKPMLGICLGMQLLAQTGLEGGPHSGLGWLPGRVELLGGGPALRVPHMGWNTVRPVDSCWLFTGLGRDQAFYFAHSYHLLTDRAEAVVATCEYGGTIAAAVQFDTVCAVQFHPEKSQAAGLRLLQNFIEWEP